jgi:hypothetical protein
MIRASAALLLALVSPQVLSAAKQEGTVVWYTSADTQALNAIVRRFEETHPGITVQVLRTGANQIPPRVMTEQTGGKFNADVINADLLSMTQLVAAGALQPYRSSELGKFLKGSYDPGGYWTSMYNATTVIAWNPQKLKADGLRPPASLDDLAKAEWRGKIGIDASAFNWYLGLLQTRPDAADLLKKIAANHPLVTDGHTVTVTQLATRPARRVSQPQAAAGRSLAAFDREERTAPQCGARPGRVAAFAGGPAIRRRRERPDVVARGRAQPAARFQLPHPVFHAARARSRAIQHDRHAVPGALRTRRLANQPVRQAGNRDGRRAGSRAASCARPPRYNRRTRGG